MPLLDNKPIDPFATELILMEQGPAVYGGDSRIRDRSDAENDAPWARQAQNLARVFWPFRHAGARWS